MIRASAVATTAVLALAACTEQSSDRRADSPPTPSGALALPAIDASSAAEADAVHTAALETMFTSPLTYAGSTDVGLGRFALSGEADPGAESSHTLVEVDAAAGAEFGDLDLETRFVDDVSYARVPAGPAEGCWFDYGAGSTIAASTWFPAAVLTLDGIARGFADDDRDTLVIDADAVNLVSAVASKASRQLFVAEPVPVPVIITMADGRITEVEYHLGEAFRALLDAGAELPDGVPEDDMVALVDGLVTIAFELDESVEVLPPDDDEVIAFDPAETDAPLEPCPAME